MGGEVVVVITFPGTEGEVLAQGRSEDVGMLGGEHHGRTKCCAEGVQVGLIEGGAPLLDGHIRGSTVESAVEIRGESSPTRETSSPVPTVISP